MDQSSTKLKGTFIKKLRKLLDENPILLYAKEKSMNEKSNTTKF